MVEDLSKQAMVLVNRPAKEKNEWGRDSYVQTFQRSRAQDSISGNNEAIHADLVFLYCNTEITSGSKTEQIFVIYYLAVSSFRDAVLVVNFTDIYFWCRPITRSSPIRRSGGDNS